MDVGSANVVGFDESKRIRAVPVRKQEIDPNDPKTWAQTPRNNPCPCGSGRKYKHCHGAVG